MNSETDTISDLPRSPTHHTDAANGDDNYAIISFIFVDTSRVLHSTTPHNTVHRKVHYDNSQLSIGSHCRPAIGAAAAVVAILIVMRFGLRRYGEARRGGGNPEK